MKMQKSLDRKIFDNLDGRIFRRQTETYKLELCGSKKFKQGILDTNLVPGVLLVYKLKSNTP
jgi:ribosomal protein S6E (S10)